MDRRASLKWAFPVCVSLGALLAGCGGSTPPASTSKAPAVPAEVAAESDGNGAATPKPVEAAAGLGHKDNDKDMVAIAQKLLGCKWESKGYMPTSCDETVEAWEKLDLEKQGKTLVHFVEDKDDRVRFLGAEGLREADDWTTDKALASTALDVFEKNPKNESFTAALAYAIGNIDVVKTGTEERVRKLIAEYPDQEARARLIQSAQFNNSEVYFDTVVGLARNEKDDDVRYAAVSSFWTGTPSGKDEAVCALWLDKTKDADERVASHAAYLAAFTSRGCPKEYDALVKLFDEKTKGKVESNTWTSAIKYMAGNDEVPQKNKKALVAIGKRLAENKENSASVRTDGLRAVTEGDPKGAKAYAAKFKNDKEKWVKEEAEAILKKEEKVATKSK